MEGKINAMSLTLPERVKLLEIRKMLWNLFQFYRDNRSAYEEAVAATVKRKAPGSTPQDRRRFLSFALSAYDEAKRNGF